MAIDPHPIDPTFPAPSEGNGITLWWLGQAGFAIRHADDLLFIDPYLSDVLADKYAGKVFPHTRMHDAPVAPADVTGLSTVLCTHGHTDHMDLGTIPYLQTSSDPLFIVPRSEAVKGVARGIPAERLLGLAAGESITTLAGAMITAVPAAHEQRVADRHGQDIFLGYVVDLGGYRIYHSGDCAPFAGQSELLAALKIDLALLPVNGRDEQRVENGVPGNFSLDEALDLCRAAGIPRLVVHHWGLFAFNTVDPAELARELAPVGDISWHIPRLGVPFDAERLA